MIHIGHSKINSLEHEFVLDLLIEFILFRYHL